MVPTSTPPFSRKEFTSWKNLITVLYYFLNTILTWKALLSICSPSLDPSKFIIICLPYKFLSVRKCLLKKGNKHMSGDKLIFFPNKQESIIKQNLYGSNLNWWNWQNWIQINSTWSQNSEFMKTHLMQFPLWLINAKPVTYAGATGVMQLPLHSVRVVADKPSAQAIHLAGRKLRQRAEGCTSHLRTSHPPPMIIQRPP